MFIAFLVVETGTNSTKQRNKKVIEIQMKVAKVQEDVNKNKESESKQNKEYECKQTKKPK